MSDLHIYTVGWICAISTEYVAAQAFLEDRHEKPKYVSPHDNNNYALGRIGRHNIVIAVLPNGEYGISSAAGVARDMLHSFPNIRIGLLVGIGGGAPSAKHDIRLGDVVVGISSKGGAVVQYDFGKAIQGQVFQEMGFLNQAPTLLRTAVSGLMAEYESEGNQIQEAIDSVFAMKPRLRKKYKRPEASSDRLYQSLVIHPAEGNEAECSTVCSNDPSNLINRPERGEEDDDPAIHYGLIASANTLMKDAIIRDKLIAKKDILCFEMEAAGLINHFPCLVIRGICDYSDSHKNKEWQGYAAMTAAAYAKDLLYQIAPNRIEVEKKISDILSDLYKTTEEYRDVAKEQLQIHKDRIKERLSEQEKECHQLFRLTSASRDATYEWYKGRIEERIENTCLWFLNHENFQQWLKQESGPLLVTADPGCGKSVLAKYLVDYGLPRSATICYFFFKDQDQNTSRQALCALLHQLFSQKPALLKHAMPQFYANGQGLSQSTQSLWKILQGVIEDPEAGSIIMVLDALDECAESELADLMQNVKNQFYSDQSRSSKSKLKCLLTSRPYVQITSKFHGLLNSFPNIRILGEEESEAIGQEIDHVITYRVNKLSLPSHIKTYLKKRLQKTPHRTYLWVYLIFDYLDRGDFKKTIKGAESAIIQLPKSVYEAYENILNKSTESLKVRKALGILLAASRPFTILEMNIAMSIDNTTQTFYDLDLEDESDFKLNLRSWCGLFISIYHGKIYFLHQTAREFLLADLASPLTTSSALHWNHSITTCQAHHILAELCVLYLNLFNSIAGTSPFTSADEEASYAINSDAFLGYSAENWGTHFREANIIDGADIIPFTESICDPNSKSFLKWFKIYWHKTHGIPTQNFTHLMVASYYGHCAVVKLLVEKGADIEAKDTSDENTPLLWAVRNGHEAVVKLLLEKGANIRAESTSNKGSTPLWLAAVKGHTAIVKLLLEKGADIEAVDYYSRTPLWWALRLGHEATVKLLLEKGADVKAKDYNSRTSLWWAVRLEHEAIVKLLLEKGADIEAGDYYSRTPLCLAARLGHEAVAKLLLEKGADVKAKDSDGRTPLWWAAREGHEATVKLLLDKGAKVEVKDCYNQTIISEVAEQGHEAIVKLLLEKGAAMATP